MNANPNVSKNIPKYGVWHVTNERPISAAAGIKVAWLNKNRISFRNETFIKGFFLFLPKQVNIFLIANLDLI